MDVAGKLYFAVSLYLFSAVATGLRCWECENVYSQEDCLRKGSLVQCTDTQNTCQITLRHGGWGNRPLIEKSCKQLRACGSNHIQDSHSASVYASQTQCNMKAPSSVCRCCCSTDGCNQDSIYCEGSMGGMPCSRLYRPKNGYMKCSGGMEPQSECQFHCKRGYRMVGSPISRCNLFSERDFPAPVCRAFRCHLFKPHMHGNVTCTNAYRHRSRCRFSCEEGYKLHGAKQLKCIEGRDDDMYGMWDRIQPECRPLECPMQTITNGEVQCSNRFFVDSTCSFRCNEKRGYELSPRGATNRCQRDEKWNIPTPCCALPCPPFALMDFVVVLDSSSSVGKDNWDKMKSFVRHFLSDFSVRDDAAHFAVVRFNREVDQDTQILLNDHPNSLENLLEAYDRIPYDGSGTRTGNALNYTASTLLRIGNRPQARDVVLLITDGKSQDSVLAPSRSLHNTGALIFVLPVRPPRGRLDLDEISIIARNPNNILRDALEGGFDALDEAFARRISGLLCEGQCRATS